MDEKYPPELYYCVKKKDYLIVARYLKGNYSILQCIARFRELTNQPFHNANDLVRWQYYGGTLSDEQFLEIANNWDSGDDFYLNLIKNKGFGSR